MGLDAHARGEVEPGIQPWEAEYTGKETGAATNLDDKTWNRGAESPGRPV
jgi:hypothetical protein